MQKTRGEKEGGKKNSGSMLACRPQEITRGLGITLLFSALLVGSFCPALHLKPFSLL